MMDAFPGIEKTEMFSVLERAMRERTHEEMENEFFYADGTSGIFQLRISPVTEGIFILSQDITERKVAENELRELHDKLKRHAEELELRVVERTRHVSDLYDQLRRTSRRVTEVQEEERKAMARDVHDSIGAGLAAAKFNLETLKSSLPGGPDMEPVSAAVQQAINVLRKTMDETRRVSHRLWPSILRDLGMRASCHDPWRTQGRRYEGSPSFGTIHTGRPEQLRLPARRYSGIPNP